MSGGFWEANIPYFYNPTFHSCVNSMAASFNALKASYLVEFAEYFGRPFRSQRSHISHIKCSSLIGVINNHPDDSGRGKLILVPIRISLFVQSTTSGVSEKGIAAILACPAQSTTWATLDIPHIATRACLVESPRTSLTLTKPRLEPVSSIWKLTVAFSSCSTSTILNCTSKTNDCYSRN